ncbi:hypothetical protein KCU99_g610, partial [Aureobasidium melanogenum]
MVILRSLPGLMVVCMFILAIFVAFASANPALVSAPSDQERWSTNEDGEAVYLAPLVIDCLSNDNTCGVQEGEYIISLRPSYEKSAHSFYLSSHIPSSTLPNTSIKWFRYTNSYIIKNLQDADVDIVRQDPGVEEVWQHYWFEVDVEWDLRCRNPELTEEEKKLCYGELEVEGCRLRWLSDKESTKCLEELCRMAELSLAEEQRELCEEQNYEAEKWYPKKDEWWS